MYLATGYAINILLVRQLSSQCGPFIAVAAMFCHGMLMMHQYRSSGGCAASTRACLGGRHTQTGRGARLCRPCACRRCPRSSAARGPLSARPGCSSPGNPPCSELDPSLPNLCSPDWSFCSAAQQESLCVNQHATRFCHATWHHCECRKAQSRCASHQRSELESPHS